MSRDGAPSRRSGKSPLRKRRRREKRDRTSEQSEEDPPDERRCVCGVEIAERGWQERVRAPLGGRRRLVCSRRLPARRGRSGGRGAESSRERHRRWAEIDEVVASDAESLLRAHQPDAHIEHLVTTERAQEAEGSGLECVLADAARQTQHVRRPTARSHEVMALESAVRSLLPGDDPHDSGLRQAEANDRRPACVMRRPRVPVPASRSRPAPLGRGRHSPRGARRSRTRGSCGRGGKVRGRVRRGRGTRRDARRPRNRKWRWRGRRSCRRLNCRCWSAHRWNGRRLNPRDRRLRCRNARRRNRRHRNRRGRNRRGRNRRGRNRRRRNRRERNRRERHGLAGHGSPVNCGRGGNEHPEDGRRGHHE